MYIADDKEVREILIIAFGIGPDDAPEIVRGSHHHHRKAQQKQEDEIISLYLPAYPPACQSTGLPLEIGNCFMVESSPVNHKSRIFFRHTSIAVYKRVASPCVPQGIMDATGRLENENNGAQKPASKAERDFPFVVRRNQIYGCKKAIAQQCIATSSAYQLEDINCQECDTSGYGIVG